MIRPLKTIICCGVLLAGASALFAQAGDSSMHLDWKDIPGARGYIVQFRDVGGKPVLDRKTADSKIDFSLPPGDYTVRIAGVNKFNKPGTWSAWQDISIRRPLAATVERVEPDQFSTEERPTIQLQGRGFFQSTELYLERENQIFKYSPEIDGEDRMRITLTAALAPGSYDLVLKNPGGKVTRAPDAIRVRGEGEKVPPKETTPPGTPVGDGGFYWQAYAPGLPESQAGDARGLLWPAAILTLAAAGGYEYAQSYNLDSAILAHPTYPFYRSPALAVAAASRTQSDGLAFYSIYSLATLRAWDEASGEHFSRATIYGGAAALVYAVHAFRYNLGFSATPVRAGALAPGLADFQDGNPVAGSAWALSFVGLTGLAVRSYNGANANVNDLANDPFYRLISEPALLVSLRFANVKYSEVTAPALVASARRAEIQSEYTRNRNIFFIAAGGAAAVYLTHFFLHESPAPARPKEPESGMFFDLYPEQTGTQTGTRAELRVQIPIE